MNQIYPNPTDGDLSIEYGENIDQIIILDLSGKLLIQLEANENGYDRLDLKDFTAGMYFVQFLSGSELIENKKLIIRN